MVVKSNGREAFASIGGILFYSLTYYFLFPASLLIYFDLIKKYGYNIDIQEFLLGRVSINQKVKKMEDTRDCQKPKGHLVLRDHLAAHRTDLANDRTFLAYLRTALTFFVAGVTLIRFFGHIVTEFIGWVFISVGIYLSVRGIARFKKMKRLIHEEEKSPPEVSDL